MLGLTTNHICGVRSKCAMMTQQPLHRASKSFLLMAARTRWAQQFPKTRPRASIAVQGSGTPQRGERSCHVPSRAVTNPLRARCGVSQAQITVNRSQDLRVAVSSFLRVYWRQQVIKHHACHIHRYIGISGCLFLLRTTQRLPMTPRMGSSRILQNKNKTANTNIHTAGIGCLSNLMRDFLFERQTRGEACLSGPAFKPPPLALSAWWPHPSGDPGVIS